MKLLYIFLRSKARNSTTYDELMSVFANKNIT